MLKQVSSCIINIRKIQNKTVFVFFTNRRSVETQNISACQSLLKPQKIAKIKKIKRKKKRKQKIKIIKPTVEIATLK